MKRVRGVLGLYADHLTGQPAKRSLVTFRGRIRYAAAVRVRKIRKPIQAAALDPAGLIAGQPGKLPGSVSLLIRL